MAMQVNPSLEVAKAQWEEVKWWVVSTQGEADVPPLFREQEEEWRGRQITYQLPDDVKGQDSLLEMLQNSSEAFHGHLFELPGKGQYRFCHLEGMGGFSLVCRVEECATGKFRILKIAKKEEHGLKEIERTFLVEHFFLSMFQKERLQKEIAEPEAVVAEQQIPRVLGLFSLEERPCILLQAMHCSFRLYYKSVLACSAAPLPLNHVIAFTTQLATILELCKGHGIIQGDFTSSNILVKQTKEGEGKLKLADWGSACFESPHPLHTTITALWWRAPEVFFKMPPTCAIDMWGLGCIVLEMLLGEALWREETPEAQLCAISRTLGMIPDQLIDSLSVEKQELARQDLLQAVQKGVKPLEEAVRGMRLTDGGNPALDAILEMLHHTLRWLPEERWTPRDVIECLEKVELHEEGGR